MENCIHFFYFHKILQFSSKEIVWLTKYNSFEDTEIFLAKFVILLFV